MHTTTTAGMVVIGDEILTGKVLDENTFTLARVLFGRGVVLSRVETIPDDIEDIARTVRRMSAAYTWVFTSGGIGPTHDDRTYEGVARAFDRKLAYREDVLARMEEHHQALGKGPLNDARKRMALMPEGCQLLQGPAPLWVPVVVVENVHVLPGVPTLFESMLSGIQERFSGVLRHRVLLYTDGYEGDIADALAREQAAHPQVAIGSYPQYGSEKHPAQKRYNVMVTIEGEDAALVEEMASRLERDIVASREPPR